MRFGPHLGTLLFPPFAVAYVAAAGLLRRPGPDREILFNSVFVTLPVFFALAAASWRFMRRYPSIGVFYSGCLLLLFPYTQETTTEDHWQFAFGAASFTGAFGLVYFGARGIARLRGPRRPLGFPVLPVTPDAPDARSR